MKRGDFAGTIRQMQAALAELLEFAERMDGEGDKPRQPLNCKYSSADKERWRHMAAQPDLMRLPTNRGKAKAIAYREKLPPAAIETIRKSI
ncbi:hypothetical protein [Variovorax boronicumulans]|uniref:hypothetical protein n=1 Tax=Variovorax boronicumulans TaxID=436515 RepID=UPI00339B806A